MEGMNCVWEGFREDGQEPRNGVCNQRPKGGTEIRDSLNEWPKAMRGLIRWTWEGLWHERVKQELTEQEHKGQGQQRSEDWTVRKELAEVGQKQVGGDMAETATLGKNEHRKAHSPKEPGRKGKFHPEIQQNFPYCSRNVKTCQWATQQNFSSLFLATVGN